MNLLKEFLSLIEKWHESFSNPQAFLRAQRHSVASLCSPPPHTLTSIIEFTGRESQDWSSDCRLYSRAKWEPSNLFEPLLEEACTFFKSPYIFIAGDDTALKKTGKKIKSAFYQRDPMSLALHPNLLYGIRFLQLSATLPLYKENPKTSCRAIPIDYEEMPVPKKPTKRASKEAWESYEKAKKKCNLSIKMHRKLKELREKLDKMGFADKTLVITLDGAFCNRNCLRGELDRTTIITRCRKDIKLCSRSKKRRRFYDADTFTPKQIYDDNKIPWKRGRIFRAGRWRQTLYKQVEGIYWRKVTQRIPLTLTVIKRIRYKRKKGYLREPGFLLCTSPSFKSTMQPYFDHIQIELNIKEEKAVGVGKAQVRNKRSVERQPAFVVACYSALLLSCVKATKDVFTPLFGPLPKWQKHVNRPTIRMLIKRLKKELLYEPNIIFQFKLPLEVIETLLKIAA